MFFSINLSGASIFSNDIIDYVLKNIKKYDLSPDNFCFEITERSAIRNLDVTSAFVSALRKYGFAFSLDDFGTGFSSFPYLKTLPIDYVKIAGDFVRNIKFDYIDFSMVKAMREMCHRLGLYTIAEYIEDPEVLEILKDIKIDFGQGFLLARPVSLM